MSETVTMTIEVDLGDKYMKEPEREEREEILDELLKAEGDTPENQLRRKLWELRYERRGKDQPGVDYFIRGWVTMSFMTKGGRGGGPTTKKRLEKELNSIRSDWGMAYIAEQGELGQKMFYQELYNMCTLYLDLCKRDRNFSTRILGLLKMKEDQLVDKIARNFYEVAVLTPKVLKCEEEFALFTKAACDVFYDNFPKKTQRKKLADRITGEIVDKRRPFSMLG